MRHWLACLLGFHVPSRRKTVLREGVFWAECRHCRTTLRQDHNRWVRAVAKGD